MTKTTVSDADAPILWARELLQADDFCILDTETTGLENTDEICQIALIDSVGNPLLNSLVKPTVPIHPNASLVHGIYPDQVANAPTFEEILIPLLKAVGRRDLVIYNAEFDLRLIRQSIKPYGMQLAFPTSDRRGCRVFLNGGSIHCAMLQYSQFVGEWNDYHCGYKWQRLPGGDHSALGDCKATLGIIRRMAAIE